ncbi:AMP-binding protein [Falsigemmobacter faecalis]|uniref:3-methylmercaptopropionyl-CoA ligase n=1 Tax=Falsigemmobacter faecalis TaxID=2488730 RepID=A0A3P3DDU0_9RHOB|nr:AMP-binding protein [Falsigemmobacter faecalis]RRH72479.1 long-chain fatty acid--CoA ligase [Falsigemmobacter faecalis]
MNPALWLKRTADLTPAAPALFLGRNCLADYAAFRDQAAAFGEGLTRRGIAPGDRVALFMKNCPDYLVAEFGIWWAGAVAVPVNAKLHGAEADWITENAGAKLVIAPETAGLSRGLPQIAPGGSAWAEMLSQPGRPEPHEMGLQDPCWLFYTSGTTGRPKGVILTAANLVAATSDYLADVDQVFAEDVALYAAPMSHGAGFYCLPHVVRGAAHCVPESGGFEPAEIFDLAEALGRVHMFAAPTMVKRMTAYARASGRTGQGLRSVIYGGGPMYLADITEAGEVFGEIFIQIYGQGECPMTITTLSRAEVAERGHPEWEKRLGSVGRAFTSVQVRIADEAGQSLPPGEIGEILVKGAPVMAGYWQNEKATSETIRDGWLRTGDMGAMDGAGYLTLHDRSKDVIITGGTNVYPREVEEALLTHPQVVEVSVIGRPDPEWGENIVAFVVADGPGAAELDAHLAARIARFKRPKEWHFVTELPKNNYGKILKTELRERLQSLSAP